MLDSKRKTDLNLVADIFHDSQAKGLDKPADKRKKIFTDREGNLKIGEDSSSTALSEIRQDTFFSEERMLQDRHIASIKLPRNTKEYSINGMQIFHYLLQTELPRNHGIKEFSFCVYYDGTNYQVILESPELEDYWNSPHTGHLYSDGKLCLSKRYNGGQPSLEEAFAKSVAWLKAIELPLIDQSIKFPFMRDQ